jgi:hypothetical protein
VRALTLKARTPPHQHTWGITSFHAVQGAHTQTLSFCASAHPPDDKKIPL